MEIIRRGKPPEESVWFGTCTNCKPNTELKALQKELKITYDQRDGTFGEANCPVCRSRVCFYEKE
jgi:hypothetical protein